MSTLKPLFAVPVQGCLAPQRHVAEPDNEIATNSSALLLAAEECQQAAHHDKAAVLCAGKGTDTGPSCSEAELVQRAPGDESVLLHELPRPNRGKNLWLLR